MKIVLALGLSLSAVAPAEGAMRVTSSFGSRIDPVDGHRGVHRGVDMAVPTGTPVLAAADGVVRLTGWHGGYGNLVEVRHADGSTTRYAHLSAILVHPGEPVAQGQLIARVGATGRATGAHLHFEYRVGGVAVDPLAYLGAAPRIGPRLDSPEEPMDVHRSRFAAARSGEAAADGLPGGDDVQRALAQ
jgi:murein DD-endopeptidase MepM/ murein hydrolase activator NlpD